MLGIFEDIADEVLQLSRSTYLADIQSSNMGNDYGWGIRSYYSHSLHVPPV